MVFVDGAAVNKKGRLAEMSRERKISLERNTAETKISLSIDLDGTGKYQVDTGCGFLNHMLELFARHGRFDLTLKCDGDTQVDYHHTTEDIGIAMGQAILEALGDKKGIRRYGSFLLPMDETLVMTALDLSGRSYLVMDVEIPTEKVGDFDTELVKEFMIALSSNSRMTLHFKCSTAKTATISSRRCSRDWDARSARRCRLTRSTGTRFHRQKGYYDLR